MRKKIRAAKLQAVFERNPGFIVLWYRKGAEEASAEDSIICGGRMTRDGNVVFTLASTKTRTMAPGALIEIEGAELPAL